MDPFLEAQEMGREGVPFLCCLELRNDFRERWFVVAFSGRTSPLFHFYSLRREMGRPEILVRRSVLLPEGRRTVGSY